MALDHPLIREENLDLRRRVIQLLRSSYSVKRDGSIIFVCGGNAAHDMRTRFREYCKVNHSELEIFHPEFAMNDYFSGGNIEQFDIADFEVLVGELSHAIVLFPEAAGSYTELGYFSLHPKLAVKTVLALDANYQASDSFISMGPAKKINSTTRFNPTIQISYTNPTFNDIIARINRISMSKKRKFLELESFKATSKYELFCAIYQCFVIMRLATIEDVIFIFQAIFKARLSVPQVKQVASVLVGSSHILPIGEFGHYYPNPKKEPLLKIREGSITEALEIRLLIADIIANAEEEFTTILNGIPHDN